jgi:3-oxoacyl-[acyl-carrier-protein] synthase III
MSKIQAAITGVHGWVPDYRLTNAILETMVDTNDDWITTRTGIKERRILKVENAGTSYIGERAVRGLLEKTNTDPKSVELIICATTTPDMQFPATANIIADLTGLTEAFGYDLNAACSGFLYALTTAAKFIESGTYKKVIVVGADKMSSIIDYKDRSTCVIFGDGGGAVLLEPSEEGVGIQDAILKSDGSGRVFLHMKAGGSARPASAETVAAGEHYVFQDGGPVFKAAVSNMSDTVSRVLERNGMTTADIDWLVPHQANKRIIDAVGRFANVPAERVMLNIQKYGNTTNGTIPLCLWEYESQLKKGDNLVLTAFGGGFTWGAVYLKWAY